jgi:proline iminopeptidase
LYEEDDEMIRKIALITATGLGVITLVLAIGVVILYISAQGEYSVPATTIDDPTLPYIELDGYRFHGETFGDPSNPTIVVLHGGPGGDYRSLLPLQRLADEFYLVFFDQRGAGLSPRSSEDQLTLEQYLTDVDLFVDRFSPGNPSLIVGHSWGAMLATAYIGRYPNKVAAAVLAEPGFLDQTGMENFNARTGLSGAAPSPSIMAAMTAYWAESLHVHGPDDHARSDYLFGSFFSAPLNDHPLSGYYPDGDIARAAGEFWRFGAAASKAVQRSGIDGEGRLIDLAEGVENFDGSVLFLTGGENTIIGEDVQRRHMKRFNDARIAIIDGAGHTMIGEKPDESLAAIRRFFQRYR